MNNIFTEFSDSKLRFALEEYVYVSKWNISYEPDGIIANCYQKYLDGYGNSASHMMILDLLMAASIRWLNDFKSNERRSALSKNLSRRRKTWR